MTRTLLVLALAACSSNSAATYPEAQIVDLSTSTTELQREFDAHAGEPRFIAIVAPS